MSHAEKKHNIVLTCQMWLQETMPFNDHAQANPIAVYGDCTYSGERARASIDQQKLAEKQSHNSMQLWVTWEYFLTQRTAQRGLLTHFDDGCDQCT